MPLDKALGRRGVDLHEQLRAFLVQTMSHEPIGAIAIALCYELVSIIASEATTTTEAINALTIALRNGRRQINHFGVGHPHP
jgi:hypothetical protein